MSWIKQSYINRIVAIIFLFLMVVDFSCVWNCCEVESCSTDASSTLIEFDVNQINMPLTAVPSEQEDKRLPDCDNPGCFCCGYVLSPTELNPASQILVGIVASDIAKTSLPNPPPESPFHPPRLS